MDREPLPSPHYGVPTASSTTKSILIVDDVPDNLRLLITLLTNQGYRARGVLSGDMALKTARRDPPHLILLDISMPEMDGYEVCQHLKADPKTCEIPIIFISALDEPLDKVHAFTVGGIDYVTKPFEMIEVLARVDIQFKLQAIQDKVCALNRQLEQRVLERTHQLEQANQALMNEIQQRQQAQAQLMRIALHDPLTHLPNRAFIMTRLEQALNAIRVQPDALFAVLFVDCDRFKVVNDSLGHSIGDKLLVAIANRLRAQLSPDGVLARLGGDEFTVLLKDLPTQEDAVLIAQRLQQSMVLPFHIDQHEIFMSISIGIVFGTSAYERPEHLLRDADIAMYQAKEREHTRYQIFNSSMHDQALVRLKIETELRRAVANGSLSVCYQPIISLETGVVTGFEALARWHHEELGRISPDVFIPVAEEIGLIMPVGLWVLRAACQQLKSWLKDYPQHRSLTMSVNLSGKQFAHPNLIQQIDEILADTELDGSHLNLEITESVLIENAEAASQVFKQLKQRHIRLSIDDFGTGYSSMSYLHRFKISTLKIDRSFIRKMHQSDESLEIIKTIITLGHNLGMRVTAEGIETEQQSVQLYHLQCEQGQGYLFAKPLYPSAATTLLASPTPWESGRLRFNAAGTATTQILAKG